MTLRYGGNTFSFMWSSPVESALQTLAKFGLNDFDVILSPGHLWPGELDGPARHALKRRLRSGDFRIDSLNPPALDYNLGSLDENVREASVRLYELALELAADLDARGVVVVPGRVSALFPPPARETRSRLQDAIFRLARSAEVKGLRLHLETHPLTSVPTAAEIKELIEGVGSMSVGVAYDLANAEFIGEDQAAAIRNLGPLLTQLHVSDGTRKGWRHDSPGDGTVDFKKALAAAEEIGFNGVAVVELISDDPQTAFKRGMAFLHSL